MTRWWVWHCWRVQWMLMRVSHLLHVRKVLYKNYDCFPKHAISFSWHKVHDLSHLMFRYMMYINYTYVYVYAYACICMYIVCMHMHDCILIHACNHIPDGSFFPAFTIQGTAELLLNHPDMANSDEDDNLVTACNKDRGEKCRLHMWSRGHLFIVRSCGHIDTWKPLYKWEL